MDSTFLEQILYEDESLTLDFTKEQYKFAKASEDEKSGLLKDILGFANGLRDSSAIGISWVPSGASRQVPLRGIGRSQLDLQIDRLAIADDAYRLERADRFALNQSPQFGRLTDAGTGKFRDHIQRFDACFVGG